CQRPDRTHQLTADEKHSPGTVGSSINKQPEGHDGYPKEQPWPQVCCGCSFIFFHSPAALHITSEPC
ncbi:unnamed protein product, partial [Candidula unifasciata]